LITGVKSIRSSGSQTHKFKSGSAAPQTDTIEKTLPQANDKTSIAECIFQDPSFESGWFQTLYPVLEGFSPLGSLQTLAVTLSGLVAKNKLKGPEGVRLITRLKMILQDIYDTVMDIPNTGEYRDGGPLSNRNADGSLKELSAAPS
jgi:hypothetical protein